MVEVRDIRTRARIVVTVKHLDMIVLHGILHLEGIPLNEAEELLYLLGLGLPVDVLQMDQCWDTRMDRNMMTAIDPGQAQSTHFRTGHRLCKADLF